MTDRYTGTSDRGRLWSAQESDVAPTTTPSTSGDAPTEGLVRNTAALQGVVDSEILPQELDAIAALPSGSALLIVRRGPNLGARFLLDSDRVTVGRHPNADIFLDDVTVSRTHALFLRHGKAFEVIDDGSLNGSYYNGERTDRSGLHDGDEVQIGKFKLTFYASRHDLPALPVPAPSA